MKPFLTSENSVVEKIHEHHVPSDVWCYRCLDESSLLTHTPHLLSDQMPNCCKSLSMSESPVPRQPAGIPVCQDDVIRLLLGNLQIMTV